MHRSICIISEHILLNIRSHKCDKSSLYYNIHFDSYDLHNQIVIKLLDYIVSFIFIININTL